MEDSVSVVLKFSWLPVHLNLATSALHPCNSLFSVHSETDSTLQFSKSWPGLGWRCSSLAHVATIKAGRSWISMPGSDKALPRRSWPTLALQLLPHTCCAPSPTFLTSPRHRCPTSPSAHRQPHQLAFFISNRRPNVKFPLAATGSWPPLVAELML